MCNSLYLPRISLDFTKVLLLVVETRVVSSFFAAAYKGSSKARKLKFIVNLDLIKHSRYIVYRDKFNYIPNFLRI